MIGKSSRTLAALAAVAIAAVACSGSSGGSPSGGSTTPSGSSAPSANTSGLKIGILLDETGLAASGNKTADLGVKAGIAAAKARGYDLSYVAADTATSPTGALAATHKLVDQDHVDVVIANSALAFAGASYMTQKGVPVIGLPEDGPEWQTAMNMFPVTGAIHTDKAATTAGKIFHLIGATNIGSLGYQISPTSSQSAKGAAASAQKVGLKVGYLNAAFPFGSTNVDPVAIAMKDKGVDGVSLSVDPNTSFALIDSLKAHGDNLKAAYLAVGYGGDLVQAGPKTLQSAQGVYFSTPYVPVEMHTKATKTFQRYLRQVGVTTDPTLAEYNGYVSVLLLLDGLKAAGSKTPSQAKLIEALSGITKFDAEGLFGAHPANPNDRDNVVYGPDNCIYLTKFSGKGFDLVKGATPICGEVIPGVKIS
jgi:ABC-type branched-subunit amino acid transport system substrate-binding protein